MYAFLSTTSLQAHDLQDMNCESLHSPSSCDQKLTRPAVLLLAFLGDVYLGDATAEVDHRGPEEAAAAACNGPSHHKSTVQATTEEAAQSQERMQCEGELSDDLLSWLFASYSNPDRPLIQHAG